MRVCFVRSSHQNVFFDELMEAFRDGFEAHGVDVEFATDHFPIPADDLVYIFVPHEYMPTVEPDSYPTSRQRARTVAVCTEQPGTVWFDRGAEVAATCAAAIDINEMGVDALRARGIRAELVRFGHVPAWDHWGGRDLAPRPIDVCFMGGHTERRGEALAHLANVLQERTASVHLFETVRPHQADDPHFISGDRKWNLLRQAKTIVNVHRSPLGYMEWQRTLGAILNGCVVITEHSMAYQPFVPGEHFVSTRFEDLHLTVDAVLSDPDYIEQVQRQAYDFLRDELPIGGAVEAVLNVIQKTVKGRLRAPEPGEPEPKPRPLLPTEPASPFAAHRLQDADSVSRMALKHLILEVRELRSELRGLHVTGPDQHVIENFGQRAITPRVSVVVTVYNYRSVVSEALMSVARSDHDAFELIVIDDCSTDDSVDVVRNTLAAIPWVSARLVRRCRNQGLAAARNLGFELARGDLVFVLDADNAVYPQALSLLENALSDDPDATFAYGIIEAFDENGPRDVMSYLGWDPARLRHGNFVDAMAMTRRDAILATGGYSSVPALHGWEDFALWCALASDGHFGVRVPEIVARYRRAAHSMISITNIDASAAWARLIHDYPVLTNGGAAAALASPNGVDA